MSFWIIIDTIFFKPLELFFEVIYSIANRYMDNPGLSIVVLSLVMNLLVLPLYKRADAIQEEQRNMEMKLRRGVSHIKKTFKGDERMMMLQTYYRQNNYKPFYVLRGAISLFLQIPFFVAAYRFLSALQLLQGTSFGPIADLGRPDGILHIAGVSVNVLPIVMTGINLASCVIYTKGSPAKIKIQLYGTALFFLVFLYFSPSGLVFYWTMNNVFSLAKTIFYRLKKTDTRKSRDINKAKRRIKYRIRHVFQAGTEAPDGRIFFAGGLFLSVLLGLLIPSSVISASPQEFVDINYFYHPLWFIVGSFCLAFGLFVVWFGIFYRIAGAEVKSYFDRGVWIFSGLALANHMFFGKDFGIITEDLRYEIRIRFSLLEILGNVVVVLATVFLLYLVYKCKRKLILRTLVIATSAFCCMIVVNVVNISKSINIVKEKALNERRFGDEMPEFTLSTTGKNVIVLMLDRAMGEYIPYMFNEKPELEEKFAGFVYYPNVISFGRSTNFASPVVFGGYEYTPAEMNKRDEETLASKHNEALQVMPLIFLENNYDVTVCDPPYANYQWITDLSIYDRYPQIKSYITCGRFSDNETKEQWIQNCKRNFFCYSLFKTAPYCFQKAIYNDGQYNAMDNVGETAYLGQTMDGLYRAKGILASFMDTYNVLVNLSDMTRITDEDRDTFLMMDNETPHEPILLQQPDYVPVQHVDNTAYSGNYQETYVIDGRVLKMETEDQVTHYHANMATMLQLGVWFDYMRENGVYDNTRIILVSDHGRELYQSDEMILEDGFDCAACYPLLMVKDFDSEGFTVCEEFMTNGDVPILATDDIIENPTNPFTGRKIDSGEKTAHRQYILYSYEFNVEINNGNTFLPGKWYSVEGDMRKPDNWRFEADDAILPDAD